MFQLTATDSQSKLYLSELNNIISCDYTKNKYTNKYSTKIRIKFNEIKRVQGAII